MPWQAPSGWTITTGHVTTQGDLQIVKDDLTFLGTPPGARVYNSANISIANNAITALTFDTERWDTDTIHSTVTNTSRLTATTAGVYMITGHVTWAANATGVRQLSLRVNGSADIAYSTVASVGAGNNTDQCIASLYHLNAGDYVELRAFQTSGGALNVSAGALYSPEFAMAWVSF